MIEKMSLEQFQQIRNQLAQLVKEYEDNYEAQLVKEYEDNYEAHKNGENYDDSVEEQRLVDQYLEIQNRLLQYDLSDIPFEAWQGIIIMSDETHAVDFSKTRANIDFDLVEYWGNGNFRGCNVRNLEKLRRSLNARDFDEETIRANSSLFLSDAFSEEFKEKYYSGSVSISDLATLSSQQLDEIKQKDLRSHMDYQEYNGLLMETLGIDKVVQLYQHSPEEYASVNKLTNMHNGFGFGSDNSNLPTFEEFLQQLKSSDISELKNICFDYARKQITNSSTWINQDGYPDSFISENSDIFLVDANIPDEVKQRYFSRKLKMQDLLDYPEVFSNIPVDYFMGYGIYITQFVRDNYGMGKFQELVQKHPDIFAHISQENEFYQFNQFLKEGKDLDSAFTSAVKEYFLNYGMPEQFSVVSEGQTIYNVPDWLSSMNFQFVDKLNINEELLQYNDSIFVLNREQRLVLDTLGIENIKRFEQETGFFTHKGYVWSRDLEMFNAFSSYFCMHNPSSLEKQGIDFKNGNLSYEEFLTQLANCLDHMRKNNVFTDFPAYDWIQGEFRENHPEIFIDLNAPDDLKEAFYKNRINPEFLYHHKDYVKYLVNKNLANTIRTDMELTVPGLIDDQGRMMPSSSNFVEEYVSRYGNEKFLQLCAKYGRYMEGIAQHLNKDITIRNGKYLDFANGNLDGLSIEDISKRIEDIIVRESKLGNLAYRPDDAPSFLRESHPELFLSDDAPYELKQFFYNYRNNYPMTFEVLQKHKDWLPFLKDKALTTSLLRNNYLKQDLIKFLELFGEEKGINLGINRAETVKEMMKAHQVELMKSWYDKTGGKFIPDFVVMQNFSLEEADKFLASGSNWSNLMRIQSFSRTPEARDAMLKLAYSFGAFDQDQRGFKKLQDLLTSLPRTISPNYSLVMDSISSLEEHGKMMANTRFGAPQGYQEYLQLKELLAKEGFQIDPEQELFSQIYRKNEDGSYSLTINPQSYPKSSQLIRNIMEIYPDSPALTPNKAHQLFGGFELKYDPDFREFLLANMDKILENPEYISYVSSVQRQFSDIKAMNSNRALTWELAVSFVQTNKFASVNVGNERVAEISAIAGYSQLDFNTLQQIYNYGKQRTFSSIPRIEQSDEKTSGRYTYETLRLDDPLAMAIGTLTDCCQELNNCAEVCMEHSMVDKNGRVFVIKDEQGNIVAQSWVWRNKDVLCFDNIEIPDKAFARAVKEHPELGRKGFTDEVFEIYKQAAHDLIEADEKVYRELLESGKINQEQYDGLRLGKVTVGLGYNDIAESLKQNSAVDRGTISRPLPFEEPVKLSRGLYTSDSTTQYVLEERDDRKEFDGETLPVHNDTYLEYTDENFTEKSLLSLEKLEIVTKEDPRHLETSISDYADSEHLVTELARNYGLNPETARIIMNPNFAIIYDVNGDKLRVGDLLFNTRVDNEQQQMDIESQVVMQMRLALEQIASDKEIDVSALDEKQQEMYAKITGLTNEMDIERGVGRAR